MKLLSIAAALVLSATTAFAQSDDGMSTGTVTKVDTKWSKVTIDHGPLENLDMPAMKMVFVVADAAMLEGLAEVLHPESFPGLSLDGIYDKSPFA